MRIFCFIFSMLMCCIINISAQNISGQYYKENSSYKIVIENSHFYYIEKEEHMPIWFNDTLAICSYEWIDKNFIKINSKNPFETAISNMTCSVSQDSTFNDSIKVLFEMPCEMPLLIDIYDKESYHSCFKWIKSNKVVKLPKSICNFHFDISMEFLMPHKIDGRFFGVTCLGPFGDIKIDDMKNSIKINIPKLNSSFFEKYYVVDEYVKVESNCIYWKGDKFIKK